MPKPSIFIDEWGFDVIPLKGTPRIRFRLDDDSEKEIVVAIQDGQLVIRGLRNSLVITPEASNAILVRTELPS